MRFAGLVAVVALAIAGPGCSSDNDTSNGTTTSALGSDPTQTVNTRIEVHVTGQVTFDFEDTVDVVITVLPDENVRFYSAGLRDFVALGDGPAAFRSAFELIGLFDGPGEYTLPVFTSTPTTSADDPEAFGGQLSQAFVLYAPEGVDAVDEAGNPKVEFYDAVAEPCEVTVGADEESGRIECPSLVDDAGRSVSWTMEWGNA